jgi:hypothetical protein
MSLPSNVESAHRETGLAMMVSVLLETIHCSSRAIKTCYCVDVRNLFQSVHSGQLLPLKDDTKASAYGYLQPDSRRQRGFARGHTVKMQVNGTPCCSQRATNARNVCRVGR